MKYTDQVVAVVSGFAGDAPRTLPCPVRTICGEPRPDCVLSLPLRDGLPLSALQLIETDHELRAPVSPQRTVPMAVVTWPIVRASAWNPEGNAEAVDRRVRLALATMPAPSALVHAGSEIWAGWHLTHALTGDEAERVLVALALQLGADAVAPRVLSAWSVPIAGAVVRSSVQTPEYITIDDVDPTRRYTPADLLREDHHDDRRAELDRHAGVGQGPEARRHRPARSAGAGATTGGGVSRQED